MYDIERIEVLVHDVRMQLVNAFRWACLGGFREVGTIHPLYLCHTSSTVTFTYFRNNFSLVMSGVYQLIKIYGWKCPEFGLLLNSSGCAIAVPSLSPMQQWACTKSCITVLYGASNTSRADLCSKWVPTNACKEQYVGYLPQCNYHINNLQTLQLMLRGTGS